MKNWALLLILLFYTLISIAQEDSLLNKVGYKEVWGKSRNSEKDTIVVYNLINETKKVIYQDPKKAEFYAFKIYYLAQKLEYTHGIAAGLRIIGNSKMSLFEMDSSIYYIDRSIEFAKKNNLKFDLMESYTSRGNAHFYQGEYQEAIDQYFTAADMADAYFPKESGGIYGSVGLVFKMIGNAEKAQEYSEKSYQIAILYKDSSTQAFALNNLGILAKNRGEYEKAVEYYEEGLIISQNLNNLRRESEIAYNLSNLYFKMGNEKRGLELLERSSEITKIIGNDRDLAIEHHNLGYRYFELGNAREAEKNGLIALEYAKKTGYWEVEIESSNLLSEIYYSKGKYKEAYEYRLHAYSVKDSIDLQEANSTVSQIEQDFEKEKEALADSLQTVQDELIKAHEEKINAEKLKSRENLLWISVLVILLIAIALFFLYRINQKVKSKNSIITLRNEQIVKQKSEIEEQHKEIKDSINYAQRIQRALLAKDEEWGMIGKDRFIYFNPKDVVSGDFYWANHLIKENISVWVTADCTGHGVPGAFMSMIGMGFLNEIVIEDRITDGPRILDLLRSKIISALEQKGLETQQKDGMDLALCVWDRNSNMLEFTGANNPLWVLRKQEENFELIELATNKMPVGFQSEEHKPYQSVSLQLESNDRIISFTDGFADQFGGEKGKKLKYKPFKEMLLSLQDLSMHEQEQTLAKYFTEWKRNYEQVDDVCVIGILV